MTVTLSDAVVSESFKSLSELLIEFDRDKRHLSPFLASLFLDPPKTLNAVMISKQGRQARLMRYSNSLKMLDADRERLAQALDISLTGLDLVSVCSSAVACSAANL